MIPGANSVGQVGLLRNDALGDTLLVLPAVLKLTERILFRGIARPKGPTCNCILCVALSIAAVLLVALNVHQYSTAGWTKLAWLSIVAIPVMALICGVMSRRHVCSITEEEIVGN